MTWISVSLFVPSLTFFFLYNLSESHVFLAYCQNRSIFERKEQYPEGSSANLMTWCFCGKKAGKIKCWMATSPRTAVLVLFNEIHLFELFSSGGLHVKFPQHILHAPCNKTSSLDNILWVVWNMIEKELTHLLSDQTQCNSPSSCAVFL